MPQRRAARIGLAAAAMALAAALAPASASAGLIGAYERYVPGRGFDIGLANIATGVPIVPPSSVNTADDELHPALSRNGRFVYFTRMRLLPSLNGDIVPPASRTIMRWDRQNGTVSTAIATGEVGGPAVVRGIVPTTGDFTDTFSAGRGPTPDGSNSLVSLHQPLDSAGNATGTIFNRGVVESAGAGNQVVTTHAAVDGSPFLNPTVGPGRDRIMLTLAYINSTTGALVKSVAHLGLNLRQSGSTQVLKREFGSAESPASHPMTRASDHTVAFAMASGGNFDIFTTNLPNEGVFTVPDPASGPAGLNTSAAEQMPAWAPDDMKLGFVRNEAARRKLAVFDATPGIQAVVNTPIHLGLEAPTPQTRSFQDVWGGVSLADAPDTVTPTTVCGTVCLSSLRNANLGRVPLNPTVTKATSIGIFVVRVIGKRKLLGRTVPRIRPVGRVPLGRARRGRNLFRWNGKVNGRRLKPGRYLLTYRTLRRKRILTTSNSVRFRVTKAGKITRVGRQR